MHNKQMTFATAILGASGYSGQETLDRVLAHPHLELVALGSEALAAGAELVFCCLEHERAASLGPLGDALFVDLSGAHRLNDASLYPAWYGFEHPDPGQLADWSYAIPELFPPEGQLIANPGC